MLASRQSRTKRRGVVLILVLAMLGLLAVIGITFATYSGQAKINARNYAVSVLQPQADELFDFALGQLIGDTSDSRSVIRGHSLARDMYGNDAFFNGYMTINPQTGLPFAFNPHSPPTSVGGGLWNIASDIQLGDPNFYGINFTRWIMRVTYTGPVPSAGAKPVDSTLEIVQVNPPGSNGQTVIFQVTPIDNPIAVTPVDNAAGNAFNTLTALYNPTLGSTSNLAMNVAVGNAAVGPLPANISNFSFSLDGRYLRAFNGPGMAGAGYNAAYGNFRYNGINPHQAGMDEDYDACDLENWFLALQSADGQVMIPSFHRPAAIRVDPANGVNDWTRQNLDGPNNTTNWATSAARILRPVAADGNDAGTFGNLTPDPNTGQIAYDVDNDGDGMTDSVWLDLGYPARRDAKNQLYKPLFAFMVIGLNGRIPLNTAGNLADQRDASAPIIGYDGSGNPIFGPGGGSSHALHLGNSSSEIDPTYALQNAFSSPLLNASSNDWLAAFAAPQTGVSVGLNTSFPSNSQVDNASIDVRLTQFRNLLAGTRPPGAGNNDTNYVYSSSGPSLGGLSFPLPNGIADGGDTTQTDSNGNVYVTRTTQPVPGRWGEAQAVPGVPFANPNYVMNPTPPGPPYQFVDVVRPNYSNPVRAGYSMDPTDLLFGTPRDAADDNYNSYDPWPLGHTGEVGDTDFYDNSGALLLPVDRMRRWLTPADINGTGTVTQWNAGANPVSHGPDLFGRVEFYSYFRPPGSPGVVYYNPSGSMPAVPPVGYRWGAVTVTYPWASGSNYAPDQTNNPTHGFESFRFPSQNYGANANAPAIPPGGTFTPQRIGGVPVDLNLDTGNNGSSEMPTYYPTYDFAVNASVNSDGLNEADEMNLYTYNPLLDSPYGPSDLEWLYRLQDVDGSSLSSRLKQLAPISFTNGVDGQRRRRLFALDTWESNGFAWANDNPGGVFPTNSTFTNTQNASFVQAGLATPALAHRDRKINLNYPLPVSNDPNEPIRQKWITDTYYMLKAVLPPKAVDTPEELAQLSQYVINIVDFRDPDSTMTHWVNPDVRLSVFTPTAAQPVPGANTMPPTLFAANVAPATAIQLDQYGMEYNPVAINEALLYTFNYQASASGGAASQANRFLIELVNTLTSPEIPVGTVIPSPYPNAAVLDLGGFQYTPKNPYSGGCWDIVFTGDDPYSRPDPYRGDLSRYGNIYGLTPLNQDSFNAPPSGGGLTGSDVILQPLLAAKNGANNTSVPFPTNYSAGGTTLPTNYFYVFGNSPPSVSTVSNGVSTSTVYESGPLQPGMTYTGSAYLATNNYTIPFTSSAGVSIYPPPVIQSLNSSTGFDPMTNGTNPTFPLYPGVLPGIPGSDATGDTQTNVTPLNYQWKVPALTASGVGSASASATQRGTQFIWVCLRRPANLFAPVTAYNPMVVVDAMRVPYIDGTGFTTQTATFQGQNGVMSTVPAVNGTFNTIYSVQRFQPYRGGHAVPVPPALSYGINLSTYTLPATASVAFDTRYGYTEQVVPPSANSLGYVKSATAGGASYALSQGIYYVQDANTQTAATFPIYHTLGLANEWEVGSGMTYYETWDYVPFHDRDFTSVGELMLVPASPPGLFTKQFVEFAPSQQNLFTFFAGYAPFSGSTQVNNPAPAGVTSMSLFTASGAIAQIYPGVLVPPVPPVINGTIFTQTYNTQQYLTPWTNPLLTGLPNANPPQPYGPAPGYLYSAGSVVMANYVNVGTASVPLIFAGALNGLATPTPPATTLPAASPAQINPPPVPSAPARIQPHSYPYLSDKFFYSGYGGAITADAGTLVGGYAADGWFKMLEFFEVPTQMIGSIGPVAQGTNFDWARQDLKPGLLNLNLIIDEEVYLGLLGNTGINQQNGQPSVPVSPPTNPPSMVANADESDQFSQQLLNMAQVPPLPAGNYTPFGTALSLQSSGPPYLLPIVPGLNGPAPGPIPLVVTATLNSGAPASAYPLSSTSLASWQNWASYGSPFQAYPQAGAGALAADPVANYNYNLANGGIAPQIYNNALKASFVQFLWLRHGGSGYMFGWGNGAVGENVAYGGANGQVGGGSNGSRIPAEIPFRSLSFPDIDHTIMRPAALPPTANTSPSPNSSPSPSASPPLFYAGDPGVRSPNIYVNYGGVAAGVPTANQAYGPGYYPGLTVTATANGLLSVYNSVYPPPIPARRLFQFPDYYPGTSGSVPSSTIPAPSNASETGDPFVNNTTPAASTPPIAAPGVLPATVQTAGAATTYTTVPSNGMVNLYWANGTAGTQYVSTGLGGTPIGGVSNPYLGAQSGASGTITAADFRQHPYWRSEQMQRVMNLTTVRTHQYAVWVTVGFFQVKRQGDIGMASVGVPTLAYDIMGPENGALDGSNVRYRAFFLIDRLKLTGFDPGNAGQFHQAVVYSNRIQ
ncbi:MAG: hypothetical protein ACLQIB_45285 [Isosphaeraceae bacterium]